MTTNCSQLKMPSPKAEPVKQWLAQVGSERLDEMADPEIAIQRAMDYYRKKPPVLCVTGGRRKEILE